MEANILVADDEPEIGMLITNSLELYGYKIVRTDSVKSAIELLEANEYDVLITDKNMPGLGGAKEGGLELLKYVKTNLPHTEVIIITGYPSIESTVGAIKIGAFDYLTKPFLMKDLKEKIDRVMEYKSFINPKSPEQKYKTLRNDIVKLLKDQDHFTSAEARNSLESIETKIDLLSTTQKEIEKITLEQRETLFNIQRYAEQLRANIHPTDNAYFLVNKICDELNKVIKLVSDSEPA